MLQYFQLPHIINFVGSQVQRIQLAQRLDPLEVLEFVVADVQDG